MNRDDLDHVVGSRPTPRSMRSSPTATHHSPCQAVELVSQIAQHPLQTIASIPAIRNRLRAAPDFVMHVTRVLSVSMPPSLPRRPTVASVTPDRRPRPSGCKPTRLGHRQRRALALQQRRAARPTAPRVQGLMTMPSALICPARSAARAAPQAIRKRDRTLQEIVQRPVRSVGTTGNTS